MSHMTEQQIKAYLIDTLASEERIVIEDHLYDCDACLALYTTHLELVDIDLPAHISSTQLTDQIMTAISHPASSQPANEDTSEGAKSHRPNVLIHYAIAASITLCLMLSGIFQGMVGWTSTFSEVSQREGKPVSQHIVDRTFQWLDQQNEHSKEVEH